MPFLLANWRLFAILIILVGAFGAGFKTSSTIEQAKQTKALQAQIDAQKVAEDASYKAGLEQGQREAKTVTVTKQIAKEVVRYVQVNPERIELPASWRMLHDAAANNDAEASAKPIDSSATVDDASAISTVTSNYATCQQWRDQVIGWQAWYWANQPK